MVCQEVGSIDAVPVDDENGRRYLIWKEDGNSRGRPTPLWAQPLSADGTKLEGERRELFRNDAPWEGQLIEGPFVVRRDGWFYLFYSGAGCCGRKCNYALGVARAKALLGPWEKNPANPILSGSDHWACPGHGSVVDDRKGRTWLLYHAYDPKTSVYVGRQGMLAEVTWKDGWPAIDPGPQPPGAARTFADEFGAKRLAAGWLWPRNQRPQLRVGGGLLTLAPEPARKEKLDGAVVGRLATAADYQAQTAVSGNGGLAIYGNEANAAGIAVDGNRVSVWRREGGKHEVLEERELTAPGQVRLRVAVRGGDRFRFAYSSDGTNWTELGGEVKGEHLPPWDLAPRIALTAAADARFDYFRVRPQ